MSRIVAVSLSHLDATLCPGKTDLVSWNMLHSNHIRLLTRHHSVMSFSFSNIMSKVISCCSCLLKDELIAAAFFKNPISSFDWGNSEEAHLVLLSFSVLKCISVFNPSNLSSLPVINPARNVICYWVNWGGRVSRPIFPLFLLHHRSMPLSGWIMHDRPFFWGWFLRLDSKYLSTVILSVMLGQPAWSMNQVQRLNCICTSWVCWLISAGVWRTGRLAWSGNFLKSHWPAKEESCFWIDSKIVVGELQWLHWGFCLLFN